MTAVNVGKALSRNSNSDFLEMRSGADLSNKIGEVIKNTRFQYERTLAARSVAERSDIYRVDQERFQSQIAAITLAEMTWLYYPEGKIGVRNRAVPRVLENTEVKNRCHKSRISAAANRAASLLEI
jgi:hypothetical protein